MAQIPGHLVKSKVQGNTVGIPKWVGLLNFNFPTLTTLYAGVWPEHQFRVVFVCQVLCWADPFNSTLIC